jgi:hypothetical protein
MLNHNYLVGIIFNLKMSTGLKYNKLQLRGDTTHDRDSYYHNPEKKNQFSLYFQQCALAFQTPTTTLQVVHCNCRQSLSYKIRA